MVWSGIQPLIPGVHIALPSIAPISVPLPTGVCGTILFNWFVELIDVDTVFVRATPLSIISLLFGS